MSPLKFSFFDEPVNALAALKARKPELHFDYDEIMHETHTRVFTVAKITKIDLLNNIQSSLEDAYKKGQSFEAWQENIKPVLAKKGWLGDVSVTNPQTGEAKQIYVGSRRLKRIFETNMRVSFARARYESQMSSPFEYFRYVAILDRRTRPGHAKLHGMILPKTHKFWEKNYPPNDWGCRCQVQVLTQSEMQSYGFKPYAGTPLNVASKDWAYNPGKSAQSLDNVLAKKAANLSGELKNIVKNDLKNYERDRNLYVWQKGLDEAIDELLIKQDKTSPIKAFQLGKIDAYVSKRIFEIAGIKLADSFIAADKKSILHIRPSRKKAYNQALSIDEIRQIPDVLYKAKNVSFDVNEGNLVYWFDDKENADKINKIIVNLNYVLKKFRTTNYMVTIGKVDKVESLKDNYIEIKRR
nr:MAG TPA: minor capsid component [Caudoviricetes sp.]